MEDRGHQLIGTQLGTCVLERVVGMGGMGIVFLARQIRPIREVAVKVLLFHPATSTRDYQEFLARFRREANVIARLDHLNILPIYEYGEQEGNAYLVMPYLSGGSLRDLLIKRSAPLLPQEALTYIEQAGAALSYAHQYKIVHRDIKPGNMLFHADGRLVLVDFGIAHINQEGSGGNETSLLTSSDHMLGSVEYMAPEMVSGQFVDHRTDIYELGIVLFQMLTGRVPFQGETVMTIAIQQLEAPLPYLPQLNIAISAEIDAVVRKATAKRLEERFASVLEMVQAFRSAVALLDAPTVQKSDAGLVETYLPAPQQPQMAAPAPAVGSEFQYGSNEAFLRPYPEQSTPPYQKEGIHETRPGQPYTPLLSNTTLGSAPYTTAPARKGYAWIGWLIAICLVLAIIVSSIYFVPQILHGLSPQIDVGASPNATIQPTVTGEITPTIASTDTPVPTVDPAQQARAALQSYYTKINQADYHGAYQFLGADLQSKQTYAQFVNGFMNTQRDDLTIKSVTATTDNNYECNVILNAIQKDGSVKTYNGIYTIGQENGAFHILAAQIQ